MAQRQKILVVDDDKISLDVNVLLLKGIDADIVTAMSGDEAIKKTIVEDFDLILTDVMMPGLDGFETIKAIRKDERNNAIPVIFITSLQGDELRIIKGLTLGAIDFITKPVRKEILNLKASNLLELQRNKRELELTARRLDQKIIEVEELNIKEQIHAKKAHEIIMQACMDGFLTIDIKGKILEANRTYANMIGYSRDELCSMSISDIEAVEESETAEKHIQKILSTGADRFDTIHKSKGGRLIPTEIGARYDSGNDQMYIFVKDITLRKLREKTQAEL
ncbi:MAG: response regulator, partial [Lentisphaerota bacterium]